MKMIAKTKTRFAMAALAVALGSTGLVALPVAAQTQSAKETRTVILSIGRGQQINLGSNITDVVVANPSIADVEVKSARQIYIFGKGPGETSLHATDAAGRTVYQAIIRVGNNLDSVGQMLKLVMPDADITVTTMNGVVLLTGTVAQPEDAVEAESLVKTFTGGSTQVVSRLKNATPLQINLHVRIAEVSRSLSKEITSNLQNTTDTGGTSLFSARGRDFVDDDGNVTYSDSGTTIGAIGRLFGIDIAAALDLSEKAGLSSTLASPNLTTLSGETGDFLVGGTFPVTTSSDNGVSVEYKDYGIKLNYTPTVLSDGTISIRVRTEVSDISSNGAIRIDGLEVSATTNRSVETTAVLGSGQSMMIAGLLNNSLNSSVDKTPGVGDIPILGALFKSNGWQRDETELMVIITPYLVKPVSESQIRLPTDGIHSVNDLQRVLLGKTNADKGDKNRPMPTIAPASPGGPEMITISSPPPAVAKTTGTAVAQAPAAPGFSFDN